MKRVLLVALGTTARADCMAEAIGESSETELYAYMVKKNPAVARRAKEVELGALGDFGKMRSFAKKVNADFAVISPDDAMALGVADELEKAGVKSFGPKKSLARLESSKSFTRELMEKYGIKGNPEHKIFTCLEGIEEYMEELTDFVVKPDGLTGGKGVKVLGEHLGGTRDALKYCGEILAKHANVIIEEKLLGEEFSIQYVTDGKTVVASPVAQDHKRAFEGDTGPNTGGMGSYSDSDHLLPFLTESDLEEATEMTRKVAGALLAECNAPYCGVMYGGFIATNAGVKLIEYNARFGDPEVMNTLPLLKSDFAELCEAAINGELSASHAQYERKASVCKYAVAQGYPSKGVKGAKIDVTEAYKTKARIYLGSVNEIAENDLNHFTTGGGRAVACVGIADSLEEAEKISEEAVGRLSGPLMHRKDIGTRELVQKRMQNMKKLQAR